MDLVSWVNERLVPNMVSHGSFGNRSRQRLESTKCKVTHKETGDDHFTSTILFINLKINFEHQAPRGYRLLVKVSPEDPLYRKHRDLDVLFHNETLMYTEVIPFVEEFMRKRQVEPLGKLFAKCYYAQSGTGCHDIIVLEDMTSRGFGLSADRLILDYDHCTVALKQLAHYHAMCYGMKKAESSRFEAMVKKIRTQDFCSSSHEDACYFLKTTSYRAIRYLESRRELDQAILDNLKDRLEHVGQLMAELNEPKEPLAVLCHGDFCRNNILFRYDSGKPCDAVLCDFQTVKYASPAIDLSLFFYLNTSSELRAQHWDDLFGEYHGTLTATLAHILDCSVEELMPDYGLEEFQKEFVAHSFYGYLMCSFFLGEMMADRKDRVDHATIFEKGLREMGSIFNAYGGETASRRLADIVKHMASLGAI